jgi:hypothetical protein
LVQQKLAEELISEYGMSDAKPVSVPMTPATKLTRDTGEPLNTSVHHYSGLVGSLLYLSVCTRPDISQVVGALSKYMSAPQKQHWDAAKHVLRYLRGTTDVGIQFGQGEGLKCWCESDFAGDLDSRKSTSGYVFTLYGGAVCWSSKLQPTVAVSTTEAEDMAAGHAVKEALWLRKVAAGL